MRSDWKDTGVLILYQITWLEWDQITCAICIILLSFFFFHRKRNVNAEKKTQADESVIKMYHNVSHMFSSSSSLVSSFQVYHSNMHMIRYSVLAISGNKDYHLHHRSCSEDCSLTPWTAHQMQSYWKSFLIMTNLKQYYVLKKKNIIQKKVMKHNQEISGSW